LSTVDTTTTTRRTADVQNNDTPDDERLHRLAVEAGTYLGLPVGESLPIAELYRQAEAHGYTEQETTALLESEGYGSAESLPVPPQGDVLGELWALEDSSLDNTVSTAKNSPSPDSTDSDSSRNACTPSPERGEPAEPLDSDDDFLGLQEPIALDGATCHPEYVEEGEPLTAGEAVERYVEERYGENTSAERHGFERGRQWHDRRNYARGMEMDRQLLEAYENPTTVLLSLRVERTVPNRVSLLQELSAALESTLDALRYRLDKHVESYEWMLVLAGTRQYATPHLHIYLWAEGDVSREALVPVVERFMESCEYAPSSGRGNLPAGGTIRIRGTTATDTIPRTEDGGSAGATYTLAQLAHLPPVDEMDFDERLWASTVRASEGVTHFRKSRYDVWDKGEEPEPEAAIEDFPENTALSEPSEQEPDSPDSDDSGEGDTNHSTESRFNLESGEESRFNFG
jgi:hypothetical protein